jgi:hypothetical protein
MARPAHRDLVIVVAALAVAVLAVAAILLVGARRGTGDGSPLARGEAIFRAGLDANGVPIPRTLIQGGGGMMGGGMMGGGMMGGGCASCHGPDGRGRSTPRFTAPNITYMNLSDPKGMLMPDGTRGPVYTDAGIRTAVIQGIDPEGSRLEWPMPQWQLGPGEWNDLLTYLKTLQ